MKLSSRPLPAVFWFGVLLLFCYLPVLRRLVNDWYIDEDMGHGFFVPVVAGYIVWQRRKEILARAYSPNFAGLAVVALGGAMLFAGTLGAELFISRMAVIVSLLGVVLTLGNWALVGELGFPLLLLLFMVPLPSVIYYQITFPLQLLASSVAETALNLVGIPVFREGNVLDLPSQKLSVVEACSGIRSLMSLSFLSLVYAHFFDSRGWMRWALLAATAPIAIFANAMRVTLTGLFSEVNPEFARGLFHSLEGWVIFMVALVLLVLTHQAIGALLRRFRPQNGEGSHGQS
jgi:exosortase